MYRIFALIICDSVLQRLSLCTNILMVTWGCKKWLTASISLESTLSKTAKCNLYILILYLISMEWGMHFVDFFVYTNYCTWCDYKIFFWKPKLFFNISFCNNEILIIVVMGNEISFTNERRENELLIYEYTLLMCHLRHIYYAWYFSLEHVIKPPYTT